MDNYLIVSHKLFLKRSLNLNENWLAGHTPEAENFIWRHFKWPMPSKFLDTISAAKNCRGMTCLRPKMKETCLLTTLQILLWDTYFLLEWIINFDCWIVFRVTNICFWIQILSVQQLHRICTLYWDDSYNTRSVSPDVSLAFTLY